MCASLSVAVAAAKVVAVEVAAAKQRFASTFKMRITKVEEVGERNRVLFELDSD